MTPCRRMCTPHYGSPWQTLPADGGPASPYPCTRIGIALFRSPHAVTPVHSMLFNLLQLCASGRPRYLKSVAGSSPWNPISPHSLVRRPPCRVTLGLSSDHSSSSSAYPHTPQGPGALTPTLQDRTGCRESTVLAMTPLDHQVQPACVHMVLSPHGWGCGRRRACP